MMTLVLNLLLSGWLFLSAFVLQHTEASAWNAVAVALAVAAVAFFAFAMPGRPGLRWLIAVLAIWLLAATMLVPHLTLASMVNEVVVAIALALGTFRPPVFPPKMAKSHG